MKIDRIVSNNDINFSVILIKLEFQMFDYLTRHFDVVLVRKLTQAPISMLFFFFFSLRYRDLIEKQRKLSDFLLAKISTSSNFMYL